MTHTKEPWVFAEELRTDGLRGDYNVNDSGGNTLMSDTDFYPTALGWEDAKRAVSDHNAMLGKADPIGWAEAAQKLKQAAEERNHANMMRYVLAMRNAEVGE